MVANPEKEIRFTRAGQSRLWFIFAGVQLAAILIGVIFAYLPGDYGAPVLKEYWWVLIPLSIGSAVCARIGWHCMRHAYLIFSPIGVEIFPFLMPAKNLDVVTWSEIDHLELRGNFLFLHFNSAETAGKAISIKPIPRQKRALLVAVVVKYDNSKSEKE